MENKKDLSEAFAVIFGIKSSEVPEKSSGILKNLDFEESGKFFRDESKIKELENKIKQEMEERIEKFNESLNNAFLKGVLEPLDTEIDRVLSAKKQRELMEKSALKPKQSQTVKETSDELIEYSKMEDSKSTYERVVSNKAVEPEYTYKVLFRDDREAIKITSNTMSYLSNYFDRRNLNSNGGMQGGNLIWGYDEDTGEQICLDSFSILAIVRIK